MVRADINKPIKTLSLLIGLTMLVTLAPGQILLQYKKRHSIHRKTGNVSNL